MSQDLKVNDFITIPEHEIEITTSRSSGAGGQHVNKTETKVTVRWNVLNTIALTQEQKELVTKNLSSKLTHDGDLLINNSESRSQHTNRENALKHLAAEIRKALIIPKIRRATKVPKAKKEARLKAKTRKSEIKKLRSKKSYDSN